MNSVEGQTWESEMIDLVLSHTSSLWKLIDLKYMNETNYRLSELYFLHKQ